MLFSWWFLRGACSIAVAFGQEASSDGHRCRIRWHRPSYFIVGAHGKGSLALPAGTFSNVPLEGNDTLGIVPYEMKAIDVDQNVFLTFIKC